MADEEIIAKDLPEYIASLNQLTEMAGDITKHVDEKIKKIDDGEIATSQGISFLEVKFHLLLSYLIDVVYYMLLKTEGGNIEGDPSIDRLVEIRTVLEKLRPIDQKMKYQIDKLVKLATTGLTGNDNDPLRFRPNPENMGKFDDDEDDSDDSETDKPSKTGVYVPPKVSAVPYDEGFGKTKENKLEEHARKRALNSTLLQELREEHSEAPLEIREESLDNWMKPKELEDEKHKQRYEEDNLIRLASKKKKTSGNSRAPSALDELTSFTDLSVLGADGGGDTQRTPRSSSGKKKPKWKKKTKSTRSKRIGTKR